MPQVYDNWERLVRATLRRENLRLIGLRTPSDLSSASSSSFNFGDSFRRKISSIKLPRVSIGETFKYDHILRASNYFNESNLIAQGHSGDLFFGVLDNETPVVVKKIDFSWAAMEVYCLREFEFYGKAKATHPRFVPLLGHCSDNLNKQLFLVYKYMPNVDLASSLFREPNSDDVNEFTLRSLDWITRLKIATGVAEALSYLHHECSPPLVHGDIQASTILLDDKYEVRLGSLSNVCTQEGEKQKERNQNQNQNRFTRFLRLSRPPITIKSTPGIPNATCTYDVYCFGKVLLELVTGKLGISASSDEAMKDWLEQTLPYISIYDKELVTNIVDPSLIVDEDLLEEVWAMAIVARSCLNPKPLRRPLMRYILKALENPLKVVREEENSSSARPSAISSRSSWNDALFGSWRHNSLDVAAVPPAASSSKQSGTTGSQGSGGQNSDA